MWCRNRAATGQPDAESSPPVAPARPSGPRNGQAAPDDHAPARGSFEPGDPFAPTEPFAPAGAKIDDESPPAVEPEVTGRGDAEPTATLDPAEEARSRRNSGPKSARYGRGEWKIQFAGNSDGTIDNEMLSLSADEVKALAALREQPLFTLRDAITKKPTAALPFDNQGHLSGIVRGAAAKK